MLGFFGVFHHPSFALLSLFFFSRTGISNVDCLLVLRIGYMKFGFDVFVGEVVSVTSLGFFHH